MRVINVLITLSVILALLLIGGCSTNTDLGGVKIPNAKPDTEITGQPPTLLEAGYTVTFHWTGFDNDGRIAGYQWKISDNGIDGISSRDTLTVDPMTGAVINPWHYTTVTDSTFLVLANIPDFEGDPVADPRSFRSHTLLVRAVDDKGAVDPTPAYMSFTSTTLVPYARVEAPYYNSGTASFPAPPKVTIRYGGNDPDYEYVNPKKVRYLWIPSYVELDNGTWIWIERKHEYRPEMIDFDDPRWSPWVDFEDLPDDRLVSFTDVAVLDESVNPPTPMFYFFAVQVKDIAGAVSVGRAYQKQVANVYIRRTSPTVAVFEAFLPMASSPQSATIAALQPVNFEWIANADAYLGRIVSYQYGWDVANTDDEQDPGWEVLPGLSDQHRKATQKIFNSGIHTFVVKVVDDSGQEKVIPYQLEVVPFVDPASQLPLLVVDQVTDDDSAAWVSQAGDAFYDKEEFRNEFWLDSLGRAASGSVNGFDWDADSRTESETVGYADIVNYKAMVVLTRGKTSGNMLSGLRPLNRIRWNFNFLVPYQQQGGNLLFCGPSSLYGMIAGESNYASPIIFESNENVFMTNRDVPTIVSFGNRILSDGVSTEQVGPLLYPYRGAGISVMDWTAPDFSYMYGRDQRTSLLRKARCAGLKGLALDEDFRLGNDIGPGEIATTIPTEARIDWRDIQDWDGNVLAGTYTWSLDEFYDSVITQNRVTAWNKQMCDDEMGVGPNGNGPNGLCVEPMFRGIARFDWVRDKRWNEGETDWPQGRYPDWDNSVDDICGTLALTSHEGVDKMSARTNGKIFGFLSHKNTALKPSAKADVYWGFDPYRFDNAEMKKTVRWVMRYFGLPLN